MIQRGGPEQTGKKDAEWLTPKGTWSPNVFDAARFMNKANADWVLSDLLHEWYKTGGK